MKSIAYAGVIVVTGDRIADAVLSYATAVARRADAVTITVPVIGTGGRSSEAQILIGPASALVVEPVDSESEEITDEPLVGWLTQQTARLGPSRPVFEQAGDAGGDSDGDDLDEFDVTED